MEKRRYGSTGCDFAGCPKPHSSRGYCQTHANQLRQGKTLKPLRPHGGGECSFPGCDESYSALGYCHGHYDQLRYNGELRPLHRHRSGCSINGCPEPHRSLGWCGFHYGRWQRYGDPLAVPPPRRRWSPGPCDFSGCTNVRGPRQWYCRPHARQLRRGEDLRPLEWRGTRKYDIDHHFFDEIDTEEKAYWLGFITADGCITSKNTLSINLATVDAGHLEKLSASLSSDYPVRLAPDRKSRDGIARWHANSMPIVSALGALGVLPRKSATATPWDGPADLMPHYWRGLVDGDGGIGLYHKRSRPDSPDQWSIHLTGSRACVEAFARWASDICGSRARSRLNGTSKTCWIWIVTGNRMAPLVVRELYGGCTVSLDRKQALAGAILGMAAQG